jgi:hypothetical protein
MFSDPMKMDSRLKPLIDAADREAMAELADHETQGRLGFCYVFWRTKKRILKQKYGVDWKDPSELNPHAIFD